MIDLILSKGKYYEDGILNAILTFPEDHPRIFNRLHPDHFSTPLNNKVFKVLHGVYQQNKPEAISNTAMISEICTLLDGQKKDWVFWAFCISTNKLRKEKGRKDR